MKWFHKLFWHGDLRRRSGFLLFPKTIGNETRWLQWAVWQEVYNVGMFNLSIGNLKTHEGWWESTKWLEKNTFGPPGPIPRPKGPPPRPTGEIITEGCSKPKNKRRKVKD